MNFLLNLALKTGVIVLLNWFGWITLLSNGEPAKDTKTIVGTAVVVALIFALVALLLFFLSFGLAVFLGPFFSCAVLYIMGETAEGFIALSDNFWLVVISGLLIGAANLPRKNTHVTERVHA